MNGGKLYGVSVGPGDPELLTLKAVRVIREADVVAVPDTGDNHQVALGIAQEHLAGKTIVNCPTPMPRDHDVAMAAYRSVADTLCALLAQGKDVAYLTLGDATVYSTYIYIHQMVRDRGFEAEIVPGVTSFCAAAAKLGVSLCEGSEQLLVVPARGAHLDDALDYPANKVFMKAGRSLEALRDALEERGQLADASMVANCGLPGEAVFPQFENADLSSGYFSVVLAKAPSAGDGRRDAHA